ncbi:helix-turn-helix transcriptional regulator [Glutamicibacter sp. M10]|uniref:helix-turn-helix transcriptional regulator n=1 Tax=Glutamicibacter sp. M10 TaxID=3023076 RepID=UPI0021C917C1|nr:helix-turn-helix transcriptional regulator [Glutamicibacter sp. M10]UXN32738.1 helix-turn-helix transcriptional regulator [Glutamicibacter sp. M10]
MDQQAELRSFLTTRRARTTPEEAGMQPFPGTRRVAGMRREEVAYLAGISVDYYTRLERGRVTGISEEILEAVSRALKLNEVEHEHLFSLVRALRPRSSWPPRTKPAATTQHEDILQRIVDAIDVPAFIQNPRLDVVASNPIGWKLFPYAQQYLDRGEKRRFNHMRFQLLDPRAQDFYVDWEGSIRGGVALLRQAAGRDREDQELFTLIGELSAKSELFRTLWASHDVQKYHRATKRLRHPLVGQLVFDSQSLTVDGGSGYNLVIYTVEPGSPTHDALQILNNWSTQEETSLALDEQQAE